MPAQPGSPHGATGAGVPRGGAPAVAATPLLEVRNLSKSFGGFQAVNDVSLIFSDKSVYGIIGPNGAGKTTLFNLLSGFLPPSGGQMLHLGRDITGMAPKSVARRGIVRSFQITSIFAHLTVAENLVLPIQRRETGGTRFWSTNRWKADYSAEIDKLLTQVGISLDLREQQASQLPYGQKRALELGISLAARPQLLLLDEPTAGMSLPDIDRITDLIGQIAKDRMVIVVEHNLGVIANLAEEIVVLQQGSVLTSGTYDEVRRDPRVVAAYLGTRGEHTHA